MALTRFVRPSRATVVSLLALTALAASVLVAPGLAHATARRASPRQAAALVVAEPTTAAGVQAKLASLSHASELLSEQLNAGKIAVRKAQAAASMALIVASEARVDLSVARQNLAVSLSAQYKASSFSHTAALLSSNSGQSYLDTVATMGFIASHQAEVALAAATASTRSQQAQAAATAAAATAVTQQNKLLAQRSAMNVKVAGYTKLLATLTAAARAKYYAATAATQSQIVKLSLASLPPASKGAAVAIAAARAELGKPYVYGASGPASFDCSGLTAWSWGAAGVNLPHSAAAQYGYGTHVSPSQLAPGDLVFFYSPISHVGIYIGNGLMIHAPTSGDVVKISPVFGMGDYVGATRIS